MRHRARRLLALCGALALASTGCSHGTVHFSARPAPGRPPELLVRGFLVDGAESRRFGYHAYLVFSENDEAVRAKQKAAIRAFMNLTRDVRGLDLEDEDEERRRRLAVLYVPVTRGGLEPDQSDEKILEAYDHLFAQKVTAALERYRDVPPVYLLGSAVPIKEALATPGSDLWVVELKGDQQAIERTMNGFKEQLLNPGKPFSGRELLERVLAFFDSVGGFVIAVATLGGSPGK